MQLSRKMPETTTRFLSRPLYCIASLICSGRMSVLFLKHQITICETSSNDNRKDARVNAKIARDVIPISFLAYPLALFAVFFYPKRFLSRFRYCIASLMCSGRTSGLSAMSAVVLPTLRMRSYALADKPCFVMAILSSSSPAVLTNLL